MRWPARSTCPATWRWPASPPPTAIEWNVGADPDSVADVLELDVPVAIVPLDATDDVPVPADILDLLEPDHAAAGADIAYETYARTPFLATPGNFWWDSAATALLADPGLGTWEDATVSINDRGRIARDAAGRPVRIAVAADGPRVTDAVLAGLRRGAPRPEPFAVAGTMSVTWDGTTCLRDTAPTAAGLTRVELHNESGVPTGLLAAGVREPKTWADALAWVEAADFSDTEIVIPDWIVQISSDGVFAEAGADAVAMVELPAGTVGVICASGEWPEFSIADGGAVTLAP